MSLCGCYCLRCGGELAPLYVSMHLIVFTFLYYPSPFKGRDSSCYYYFKSLVSKCFIKFIFLPELHFKRRLSVCACTSVVCMKGHITLNKLCKLDSVSFSIKEFNSESFPFELYLFHPIVFNNQLEIYFI